MREIGAIILAAGSSSRMGRTKQLMRIDGESLVRRTARSVVDAGFAPIVVVTGSESEAVANEVSGLAVATAFNPVWASGIGSSIRCGISALLQENPAVQGAAIVLCDQPRLNANILRQLITAYSDSGKAAAACEYAQTVGPPCCFGRSVFGELGAIADADGAKKVLMADPMRLTKIPWPDGARDVDTPEDWKALIEMHGSSD